MTFPAVYPRGGEPVDLPFAQVKNNMVHEIDAFARIVSGGASTAAFDEQSLRVMRLLDEAPTDRHRLWELREAIYRNGNK
ncbi:MAG: hypothetical protein R2881_04000 [Eubacteriales bacterium]